MNANSSPKIQILPETVSSRIAAGEVVERPSAVVKELIDNSLDAGSTMLTITIKEGGRKLIRVTDNGLGMCPDDAQLACQRFATSKIRDESDLQNIQTLGFRGEALPSIASVSKFRLLTQSSDFTVGTELYSEGGETWSSRESPAPQGTQVDVQDLFFNTPARLKFLKSVGTEFSKICLAVQQAALVHHAVHFRLLHNDHSVFDYPNTQTAADRLVQVYGTRLIDRMLPLDFDQAGIHVTGLTVSPYHTRSSRTPQDIFVNRRAVKNTTITHAAYEAYGSFLPKGQHPVFALFLNISPAAIDVNVHPAKREVRFSQADVVHSVIKAAIRQPLKAQTRENIGVTLAEGHPGPAVSAETHGVMQSSYRQSDRPFDKNMSTSLFMPHTLETATEAGRDPLLATSQETRPTYSLMSDERQIVSLGQVRQTFLIAQVNGELQIVDQHTAHERVLFERLWRAWQRQKIETQPLLIPEPIDLPAHQCDLLAEYVPELAKLGLEIEPFGGRSFVIRAVPSVLGTMPYSALIQDVLDDLAEWKSHDSLDAKVRPVFASMACQSAVQAGRPMNEPEITRLLTDWAEEGNPMTCPHGRRVALRFSPQELDKIFGRA
ncbi:MAG: DNA mismatch repair endonuclease MutL [Nitrospirales bacterium]|nr:DNA mismatch repair endonuclease MutL [Nitrospira sp.]MDR4501189.1 DNA mismatch repair endonuclease MutL [Nitrospirales bacterium]